MVLPIVLYGDAVLRKKASEILQWNSELKILIDNMFETMYQAKGVGLAAPQIGKSLRVFVIDARPFAEDEPEDSEAYRQLVDFKKVFINAQCTELSGELWNFNEGCLSIPKIREDVLRPAEVTLQYWDEQFQEHTETFKGITARVILHEYDHIEGKLFIDYLKPLRRKMLQGKLNDISKGKMRVDYKMILAK